MGTLFMSGTQITEGNGMGKRKGNGDDDDYDDPMFNAVVRGSQRFYAKQQAEAEAVAEANRIAREAAENDDK